jgi:hypothetical protein
MALNSGSIQTVLSESVGVEVQLHLQRKRATKGITLHTIRIDHQHVPVLILASKNRVSELSPVEIVFHADGLPWSVYLAPVTSPRVVTMSQQVRGSRRCKIFHVQLAQKFCSTSS